MNIRLVMYLLGKLSIACAVAMVVPMITALLLGEYMFLGFIFSFMICAFIGGALIGNGEKNKRAHLNLREALATVGCGWLLVCFLGAIPYYLSGLVSPVGAIFESTSGFTTTGVTTLSSLSNFPDSLLVWRSMTHWTGGIGVIMLFITIMPQVSSGANYLFNAEIPGPAAERTLPKIKESAFVIFTVYIFFTIITTVALKVAGMSWFMAMNLALASVATGGFSYQYESLMEFETVYVEMIVIIAMVAASLNFALYYKIYQHNFKVFWIDTERKAYFWIIGIATFLITWNLYYTGYFDAATSFRHALFQTVSIASTTGFASSDFNLWPDFSRYVLLLLMFVGGCSGSTAGGMKVSRFVILLKVTWAELRRTIHPRLVYSIKMGGRNVPPVVVGNVTRFFYLYMIVFSTLTLLISLTGISMLDSMGIIAACMSSVGPAFGIVGPTATYADVSTFGRLVVIAAMILGRLEIFTLLIIMRPDFWRVKRNW